jgi:mgtE-like transporter
MATVADIFITFFYIFILKINFTFIFGVFFIFIFLITLSLYVLIRNRDNEIFLKTIRESFFTLILVALIVPTTGTFLKRIGDLNIKEITTIYPSLINIIGSVGSVVGSTATTKLALGLLSPSFSSIKNHLREILSAWSASIIIFSLFSILSLIINGTFNSIFLISLTTKLLLTNIIAVFSIVLFSYFISILTFKKGLDPDNFVIPIESSLADSLTSVTLLIVLTSFI